MPKTKRTKKQHYIAQGVIKAFFDSSNIYEKNVHSGKTYKTSVNNTMCMSDSYEFPLFDDNYLENLFATSIDEDSSKLIKELKELAEKEGILSNIEVTEISKFPDVLTIKNNQDEDSIKQELIEVTKIAIENLLQMRENEGNKIAIDLLERIEEIEQKSKEISQFSTGLIQEYVVKLEKRIKELLQNQEIDQSRLAQEVVIYADKCSIEEEITRLESHISQFKNLINQDTAVGKKLDFIIQEMNRETNTIGSKANNLEITNEVINIKTQLENIREQIQNIE